MKQIHCQSHDAAFYLALEEHLLGQRGGYFFFWRSAPCVVIGKHQNAFQEVNVPFAEKENIPVFRRSSGGGAVYHDLGNLNFTFVRDDPEGVLDYNSFLDPVTQALQTLGVPVQRRGSSHLFIGDGKISGNAQGRRRGRVLHHGTLLFDSDLSVLGQLLFIQSEGIASKAIRSTRSAVVNIRQYLPGLSIEGFSAALGQALFPQGLEKYTLTQEDKAAVQQLCEKQYHCWDWNFGRSPGFALQPTRQGAPTVEVEKGRILRCDCPGLPDEVCHALQGQRYSYRQLQETLNTHPALSGWNTQERDKLADSFFVGQD